MRPQTITVLCIALFGIGISLTVRSLAQFIITPGFYTFFMLIISMLGVYCYYGLWTMKRQCIPLFFLVWIAIPLPMLFGFGELTTITVIRSSYFVIILAIFSIVVLPHRNKFSEGPIWEFKKSRGDQTESH